MNVDTVGSAPPASVIFTISSPPWLTWWFQTGVAGLLFMLGYSAYAYRLRHAMALQRIRTRLAADLHDDLGSGLAEIAVLAEVAKQKAGHDEGDIMETVAERARELRGAMGEIVWSVDPAGDNLTWCCCCPRAASFSVAESWTQASADKELHLFLGLLGIGEPAA